MEFPREKQYGMLNGSDIKDFGESNKNIENVTVKVLNGYE